MFSWKPLGFGLVALVVLLWQDHGLAAQPLPADTIMRRVYGRDQGKDMQAILKVTLVDRNGAERHREVLFYRQATGEVVKTLVRVLAPADLERTGLLTWNYQGRESGQWLYLPSTRRVRRVSSSFVHGSFLGSDVTYEDLREHRVEEDRHTLARSEAYEGAACFVIESIPVEGGGSLYGKILRWIRHDNDMQVKAEFFDKEGRPMKTLRVTRLEQVDGIWTPLAMVVEEQRERHTTVLTSSAVRYNTGISDEIFTQRYLER